MNGSVKLVRCLKWLFFFSVAATMFMAAGVSIAKEPTVSRKSLQDTLNEQVINKPFDPDNPANLEAYLDNAVKKGVKPPIEPGIHWRPGYTCNNLLPYPYQEYRNCMLYYRYYGCYYCR